MNSKILVAAAWPYVNGDIHIGHLAGYFIPADIFTRYSRLKGIDAVFVSGSDCHGTPITVEADKRGITAKELVGEYIPKVHEIIKQYNIAYSLFTSTITENHRNVTQEVFLNLFKNGFISKKKSEQYYSEADNKFLPDRYVEGECPHCHAQNQRSDQCENCGRSLDFGELINPYSKLTNAPVTLKETEHYFLNYPKLEDQIKEFVLNHENVWKDWVFKETTGFLNEGLKDRAITRDLDWGVEIPLDKLPESERIDDAENKRFYVWFDAVIGYLSATIEYCNANNLDYKEYWNNKDCKHYYFMGQDNLTFHTIFWPGQLIGQNLNYNLPYFPAIVKFLNANGQKLSKSRGNIIDAKKVGEHFGVDFIRYYITSILPENKEGNWDWIDFKNTVNADLAGNIGNFVHRVLTFYKNKLDAKTLSLNVDTQVQAKITETYIKVSELLENGQFVNALDQIKKLSTFGNQYFDHNKPWEVLKTDENKALEIVFNCLQIVNNLRILLKPFMPDSSDKLSKILGQTSIEPQINIELYTFSELLLSDVKLEENFKPLFPKLEDELLEAFTSQN
jgi:methionyl-tRNA synthetase